MRGIKPKTQLIIDTIIFAAFVVVLVSGLVLFFAGDGGGYQGGRNPEAQSIILLLTRHDWKDLHNQAGLVMGGLVVFHLFLHIPWIVCQAKRLFGVPLRRVPQAGECATVVQATK
jgi:uncharacterized iron-regulated membrane protein